MLFPKIFDSKPQSFILQYIIMIPQQTKQPQPQQHSHHISTQHHKYYFTELSLISELLYLKLKQNLNYENIHVTLYKINPQGDICTIDITYQYWQNAQKKEISREQNVLYKYTIHITVLQIQTIIKFHIIYKQIEIKCKFQKQFDQQEEKLHERMHKMREHMLKKSQLYLTPREQGQKMEENDGYIHIKIIGKQEYQYIDQFWIKYTNYLPKKLYQSYLLSDFNHINNKQKTNKLIHIFNERISRPALQKVYQLSTSNRSGELSQSRTHTDHNPANQPPLPSNIQLSSKQFFITAISNNYNKIFKYLKPKQYKNLEISSRQLYKILHTQKNYKILFEQKWGKTGFDLQEKNWIKFFQNKILSTYKHVKKQGFYLYY